MHVACKLPLGINLEFGVKGEPGFEFKIVKGANEGKFNAADGRFIDQTVNGYGYTKLDAEFWKKWSTGGDIVERDVHNGSKIAKAERNARVAIVAGWKKDRLLDVFESRDELDMYREANGDVRTGFEPFDPAKMPKGLEASDRPSANSQA